MLASNQGLRRHLETDMMHDAIRADVLAARVAESTEQVATVRKDLDDHVKTITDNLAANASLEIDGLSKEMSRVQPSLEAYVKSANDQVKLREEGKQIPEASWNHFCIAFSQLEEDLAKVSDIIEAANMNAAREQADELKQSSFIALGAAGLASVILSAFSFGIIRSVTRPITACVAVFEKLAAGDLSQNMPVTSNDEIGVLARAADSMTASMRTMIREVRIASESVAATAAEISASGDHVEKASQEQATGIVSLASTIKEVANAADQVAHQCELASSQARSAGDIAEEGGKTVGEAIQGMQSIEQSVRTSAETILDLGKRSEEIGHIISVIDEIADQTNLLALNAAIEAARAGEHGRGFAVVADEVRKLADRTTSATEQIAKSINAIRTDTDRAVSQMNEGTQRVGEGVNRATQAGAGLDSILQASGKVRNMIETIASAAEEQRASSTHVAELIAQISDRSREASAAVSESVSAGSALAHKADDLRTLVSRFKV
jgi:methyl-accepting chemotaxis protein